MSNDYGAEVVSILDHRTSDERDDAQIEGRYGLFIGDLVPSLLAEGAKVLYFPPGRYVLQGPPLNPMVPDDLVVAREYIVPEGVELYFAINAILRVEKHAVLPGRRQGSTREGRRGGLLRIRLLP